MSRDTTRMTIQRGTAPQIPSATIDRDQQRLVGQRIEQGAQFARHVEALGEKAVDRVADAGDDEDRERDFHLAGGDRPDDDRHQNDAAQRNDIWNTQLGRFPATGLIYDPALCGIEPVVIYIVYARSRLRAIAGSRNSS